MYLEVWLGDACDLCGHHSSYIFRDASDPDRYDPVEDGVIAENEVIFEDRSYCCDFASEKISRDRALEILQDLADCKIIDFDSGGGATAKEDFSYRKVSDILKRPDLFR